MTEGRGANHITTLTCFFVLLLYKDTTYESKQLKIVFYKLENIILTRANASFKHLKYFNILSLLKIVRYEISFFGCFVLDFFCKSIKNSEPKCEPKLPYINTEGLGNVIRL